MRIDIKCKNYHVDESFKGIIEKKLNKFDKYFSDEAIAKVKLTKISNDQFSMEISLDADGAVVRSSTTSGEMKSNLDIVLPKLERQIVKYHDKLQMKFKKLILQTTPIYAENNDITMEDGNVVKVKNFDISVITVAEAIEQMEILNHNFYVFRNIEDNKVCVLYRRYDGDYGMIETEE
jgi:putative sigma-54 modulation protein